MLRLGVDFQMKTLNLGSTTITLQLWDTAGQERSDVTHFIPMFSSHIISYHLITRSFYFPFRFRSITEQYYRKADGILAMYDITHYPSFTAVRGWMDSVKVSRWRWKNMQNSLSQFEYTWQWQHSATGISKDWVINLNFCFLRGFFQSDVYDNVTASTLITKVCILRLSQEKMCEGTVLMLLANKLDLADSHSRQVTAKEGQRLAEVKHI